MTSTVVVGGFFGDEGKGKIISYLAIKDNPKVIVRGGAGPNAGHTIIVGGQKTVLHLLPSGVLTPGTLNIIGNGCVVDIVALAEEIEMLRQAGQAVSPDNLLVTRDDEGALQVKLIDLGIAKVRGGDENLTCTCRGHQRTTMPATISGVVTPSPPPHRDA